MECSFADFILNVFRHYNSKEKSLQGSFDDNNSTIMVKLWSAIAGFQGFAVRYEGMTDRPALLYRFTL